MELTKTFFMFTILFVCHKVVCFIDPISIGLIGTAISGLYLLMQSDSSGKTAIEKIGTYVCEKVGVCEGCEDYWITSNIHGLEVDLKSKVFGQPMALDIVLSAMKHHVNPRREPTRALMLSFHGSPGTGKNFVSQKILKNMFKNGAKTKYVHFFRGSIDFPSKSNVAEYKKTIIDKVKAEVLECHRSIFVFDEVEKMPAGILDVLSAFVKAGKHGVYDFRRAIFILLSNTGSELISQEMLKNYRYGKSREDMDSHTLQQLLAQAAFNLEGGLQNTGLIKSLGVSYFVPFLPLEREHVIQCLEVEVAYQEQIMSPELVDQVLQELTFGPPELKIYSYAGCKGIAEKAAYLFERERFRMRKAALDK